jgi:hypothetical protein
VEKIKSKNFNIKILAIFLPTLGSTHRVGKSMEVATSEKSKTGKPIKKTEA